MSDAICQVIIDREAREIMYLVASVCPSPSALSRLNRLSCQGQISGAQWSILGEDKGNKSHFLFKVFVFVSVVIGCLQIISQIRSIGF